VELFDSYKEPPSLLQMGDMVQFYPITEIEFKDWIKKRNDESQRGI
jgi:allophanate hydrolase subunit 1